MSTPPFLLRGLARGLDLGVQILVLEAAYRCSSLMPAEGLIALPDEVLTWVDLGVGVAALVLYTTLAEWLGGATLGKACTRMRVVPADDPEAPLTLRAAAIRSVAFFVDGLIFGLVAYSAVARSERGQRVGDHWAGTVVVWARDAPPRSGHRGWPVGALAALALVLMSYLLAR